MKSVSTRMSLASAAMAAALFGTMAMAQDVPMPSLSMDDVVIRAGQSMEIGEVKMDQAGWIVVHDAVDSQPVGPSLTQVFVNPGAHNGVLVPIDGGWTAGKAYIISLHHDSNGNGTWDHETDPAVDGPVIRADGSVYAVPFIVQGAN